MRQDLSRGCVTVPGSVLLARLRGGRKNAATAIAGFAERKVATRAPLSRRSLVPLFGWLLADGSRAVEAIHRMPFKDDAS
ncbi:hypothetical protein [Bradyrhizobium sp.]|uniref:hypothetical protein n=1 Tax=Bradyrhizobium sp. TaxID=376 RepID=UPI002DDC91AB|nr:hypothetical protein [Bradyrhizobium sp.]HEV2153769.1 hypothetical protein [Bradyrhizobium sp.]